MYIISPPKLKRMTGMLSSDIFENRRWTTLFNNAIRSEQMSKDKSGLFALFLDDAPKRFRATN
jgi:hypothetical protein